MNNIRAYKGRFHSENVEKSVIEDAWTRGKKSRFLKKVKKTIFFNTHHMS